ncbi:hypothetical protein Tco_0952280 [Tanacetum coccineum]|uniref:Uncharacterized protein n=1 Tax=Tanacetum coccineum TaxID=301880 RepID=A0ABQ5DWI7_9ASTR
MASFDYRLNPLYTIKECSSCGALYTINYCCSKGGLVDKIVRDPNKTPDSSQRPPQNCARCGNPVDGPYCRGCALLRKKFMEDLFTYYDENGIFQDLQDTSESSNDNTNVVNAHQEPFVVKQDPGENSSQSPPHIDHNFPIISNPGPCNNQTIDELPQTLPRFDPTCYSERENSLPYVSKPNFVDDSPNVFNPPLQPPTRKKKSELKKSKVVKSYWKFPFAYDDKVWLRIRSIPLKVTIFLASSVVLQSNPLYQPRSPVTLHHGDNEHLDTISRTKSQTEFIKSLSNSSVENLVQNPSESEDASDGVCDLPICDDFPKSHLVSFSNPLFDINDDCTSSDDESFSEEDVPMENFKIFSNPLFDLDEEIVSTEVTLIQNEVLESITSIPPGIDSFYAESNLIESLFNRNTSIDSSSKIDSLLDEFAGELTLLKSIPPGIDDATLIRRLNVENSIESFSPSPIPVEDSDSLMEEIDLFLTSDDSMPPGIENDDYDSEGDILFLEELISNDSSSLPKNESFHFNIPSSPRPPAKPPDDGIYFEPDMRILTLKVVGNISEHHALTPRILPTQPTLASNEEKSPYFLSHRGFKAFQLFPESPMMIHGESTPNLGVCHLHFYPP